MSFLRRLLLLTACVGFPAVVHAEEGAPARTTHEAQEFHRRSQQRTGLLVPMYFYPGEIQANADFQRLLDLKRRYPTVPMWVIANPASGPGEQIDANYLNAIDRLVGAGCVVLGYVTTSYGERPAVEVREDIDQWLKMYPRIHGIFFDEMIYEDTDAAVAHQASLSDYAHAVGCWPTVANPGADTPGRYFAADAADVIVVHEGNDWPEEERLAGKSKGGYADYPPFMRGVLVYGQPTLDETRLAMVQKYARWVYVTEDVYRIGDPKAPNPWDLLSKHLEEICIEILTP